MTSSLAPALREAHAHTVHDLRIFDRVIYRNRNQHRRSVFFRRLMEIRRLKLAGNLLELSAALEAYLPTHDWLPLQDKLRKAGSLLAFNLIAIGKCSREVAHLVKQTFFLPVSLTLLGLLARFYVVQKSLLVQICDFLEQKSLLTERVSWLGGEEEQETPLSLMMECHRLLGVGTELPWLTEVLGRKHGNRL